MHVPKSCYAGPITPLADPTPCPGVYDMHFYCKYDNPEHDFHEFPWHSEAAQTRGEAIAQVRARGALFHKDNTFTCPKCVKALGLRLPRAADAG